MIEVWNDNVHPYREMFKGNLIEIPANKYIMMDPEDAVQFRGTMPPNIEVDATGKQKPHTFKKIRLGPNGAAPAAAKDNTLPFICHADGARFPTQQGLDAYVKAMHSDKLAPKDDEAEALIQKEAANDKDSVRTGKPGRPRNQA